MLNTGAQLGISFLSAWFPSVQGDCQQPVSGCIFNDFDSMLSEEV